MEHGRLPAQPMLTRAQRLSMCRIDESEAEAPNLLHALIAVEPEHVVLPRFRPEWHLDGFMWFHCAAPGTAPCQLTSLDLLVDSIMKAVAKDIIWKRDPAFHHGLS